MLKRILCMISLICLGLTQLATSGEVPDLVAWWELNDGSGTAAADSSGNGHDGEIYGNPVWVEGIHGGALEFTGGEDRVEMPTTSESQGFPSVSGEVTWAVWFKTSNAGTLNTVMAMGPAGAAHVQGNRSINVEAAGDIMIRAHSVGALTTPRSVATVADGDWHHVAVTLAFETDGANDTMRVYIDGDLSKGYETTNINVNQHAGPAADFIITLAARGTTPFIGLIDDVAVFARALSADEILTVMQGLSKEAASALEPQDGAIDVLRDTDLTWQAGQFAATHDVYLGTSFDDVNNASVTDPLGVLVSQGQTDTRYDAGILDFGQTYYWRIDEVNGAPDNTVFKGDVWRFEVEPFSIPIAGITVTASSAHDATMTPENTINGSGLNELDQHETAPETMWLSGMGDPAPTLQYAFDQVYKLHEMWVWNSNQLIENFVGLGAKDVTVEVSANGTDWTGIEGVPAFAQAPGSPTYTANTTIDFGGVQAQYVRLTVNSGYGMLPQFGLAEVRFFYVPTLPREPQPADAATTDTVDVVLSWRAGREAAAHEVYLGTDSANLSLVQTTPESSAAVGPLDYGTTYYWQVVEVNDAEDPAAYAGPVWRFSTPAYGVVDSFDQYDDNCRRIFFAWLDGLGHNGGEDIDDCDVPPYNGNGTGSIVGNAMAPFAEQTIVYAGNQSMPLEYDSGVSETTLALDGQDWTAGGIKTLSLMIQGGPDNTGQLYLKINNTKVTYQGMADALQRTQWIPWNIDLAATGGNLSNVTSLTLGIENASTLGKIYVDEIRLYPLAGEQITPSDPGTANLMGLWSFDEGTGTVAGDSSGNGYDGALNDFDDSTANWGPGVEGSALFLNSSAYVETAYAGVTGTASRSCCAWIKTTEANRTIMSWGQNTTGNKWRMRLDATGGLRVEVNGGYHYGSTFLADDEWHHVAVTLEDDGTADVLDTLLFVDGLLDATAASLDEPVDTDPTGVVRIGKSPYHDSGFIGQIDEPRVYDRALLPGEVLWLAGIRTPIDKAF